MFRYYLKSRPPSIGCQPNGSCNIYSYEVKTYIQSIDLEVWGYAEYNHPLTDNQISDYELVKA